MENSKERYSFSKLSAWWVCPYGYFLRYIERKTGIGNAFASYGTLVHEIMEKYAKGEAELWDLPQMFEWLFDSAVQEKFPPIRISGRRFTIIQEFQIHWATKAFQIRKVR